MSNVPGDLKYTKSHEWVRIEDDGTAVVGITDHAQAALGDLVFVETPEVGATFDAGDACAVVESVKAASDVYSPLAGEVVDANGDLADTPELVNQDPYGDGWIMRQRLDDADEAEDLLDASDYEDTLEE
jgi:glycine cleavage system H protein